MVVVVVASCVWQGRCDPARVLEPGNGDLIYEYRYNYASYSCLVSIPISGVINPKIAPTDQYLHG